LDATATGVIPIDIVEPIGADVVVGIGVVCVTAVGIDIVEIGGADVGIGFNGVTIRVDWI
jgi:hypothetical protein